MDYNFNIAHNIRSLRESKQITQEQLASVLGVSYQAVSKWENAVTTPDVMMLPMLADYFGISIDDLFKRNNLVYQNDALVWLAKYEASHNQDDFIRADIEFRKLFDAGQFDDNDIRGYGILYEYHMYYCRDKAIEMYNRIISAEKKDEMFYRVCRQKSILLSNIGQAISDLNYWEEKINKGDATIGDYICLMNICILSKEYGKGKEYFKQAINKISADDSEDYYFTLYTLAGDIYKGLQEYELAQNYWNKALETSDNFVDPLFSIGFCYEELGEYEKAAEIWRAVIKWMTEKGYSHELSFPRELLKKAEMKIKKE